MEILIHQTGISGEWGIQGGARGSRDVDSLTTEILRPKNIKIAENLLKTSANIVKIIKKS